MALPTRQRPAAPDDVAKATPHLSRLGQLRQGKRALKRVRWPGEDLDLDLQVLSCGETQEAYAGALARFRSLEMSAEALPLLELFQEEVVVQLMWRACRDPEDAARAWFPSVDEMRSVTTVDERNAVWEAYCDHKEQIDPDARSLTAEDEAGILDAIKKKDASSLRGFGCSALANYMLFSASPPSN